VNFPVALLSGAAVFALIYALVFSWHSDGSLSRSLVKTSSVVLLALAGWAMLGPWQVVAGLAFGAAGDFCLSRPGTRAFLSGMAAFALGHVAYAVLFLSFADPAILIGDPRRMALALGLLAVVLSTEVWLAPRTGNLRGPVRAYVVIIAVMGFAALAVPHSGPTIGASLFLLSDLLLALRNFVFRTGTPRRFLAVMLWPAYWTGQFSILLAALDLTKPG
jgi:uncharacterized membrane protein YhhN